MEFDPPTGLDDASREKKKRGTAASLVSRGNRSIGATTTMMGNSMRILVVRNPGDLAERTTDFLKSQGHEVEAVTSAAEALARASKLRPDLVMIDGRLDEVDRSAFAEKLRGLPGLQETLVVVGLTVPHGEHVAT
jgi:CheY-like chemotaxis protein